MKDSPDAGDIPKKKKKVRWFWILLVAAVIFTITGLILGDPFQAYQTAATL